MAKSAIPISKLESQILVTLFSFLKVFYGLISNTAPLGPSFHLQLAELLDPPKYPTAKNFVLLGFLKVF